MQKKRILRNMPAVLSVLAAVLLILGGCGSVKETGRADSTENRQAEETENRQAAAAPLVPYQAPEFAASSFHAGMAQGDENVQLDLSALSLGYVAVSARSDSRLKFQVVRGEIIYTYDLLSDGTPAVFPLQSGNGTYTFRVMENVAETKYATLYSADGEVMLLDEFQPFLRPSEYVSYNENSQCVREAARLAGNAEDAVGVIAEVYGYICDHIEYDREKAASVQSGYLPDPDETLKTGKGICFDYASLAAAMLRSQGIPTKVIFGYVSPDDLYHAWNMFYTDETGWVTVDYQTAAGSWNRLDLTFSANGADGDFIGDGENYTDVYFY